MTLPFYEPEAEKPDGSGQDPARQPKQEAFLSVAVREASKLVRPAIVAGSERLRCQLFRLPISLRFKIYGYLFPHDGGRVEIETKGHVPADNLAILRTCHVIYHEASLALLCSLRYRNLVFKEYEETSFAVFERRMEDLVSCHVQGFHKHLQYPCRTDEIEYEKKYQSITLELGSSDKLVALHRRWSFTNFMLTLKYTKGPLTVYSLTIVAGPNWKIPGFDEKDLVCTIFNGGLEILGDITLKGFNKEELGEIFRIAYGMGHFFLRHL